MSEEVKNEFTFENPEYRQTYWHTCSHVLAQAMKRLHPEVKLAIGPSIDEGWYYDLDAPFAFTPEHLEQIEAEMRKICKEKLKLERFELPREEALKFMEEREEPYKVELIEDLPEDAAPQPEAEPQKQPKPKSTSQKPEQPPVPCICARCNQPIKRVKLKDGSIMQAAEFAATHEGMCADCYKATRLNVA